jgi:hypothetical protein
LSTPEIESEGVEYCGGNKNEASVLHKDRPHGMRAQGSTSWKKTKQVKN